MSDPVADPIYSPFEEGFYSSPVPESKYPKYSKVQYESIRKNIYEVERLYSNYYELTVELTEEELSKYGLNSYVSYSYVVANDFLQDLIDDHSDDILNMDLGDTYYTVSETVLETLTHKIHRDGDVNFEKI